LAVEGKVKSPPFLVKRATASTLGSGKDLGFVEPRIQEKLKPYAIEITLLDEILGVDATLAGAIIAELGVDMSVFENVSPARLLGGRLSGQQ
jgi:hypothetical protein